MELSSIRPELNILDNLNFSDKANQILPPIPWEQWRDRFHVALLAKYNIDTSQQTSLNFN